MIMNSKALFLLCALSLTNVQAGVLFHDVAEAQRSVVEIVKKIQAIQSQWSLEQALAQQISDNSNAQAEMVDPIRKFAQNKRCAEKVEFEYWYLESKNEKQTLMEKLDMLCDSGSLSSSCKGYEIVDLDDGQAEGYLCKSLELVDGEGWTVYERHFWSDSQRDTDFAEMYYATRDLEEKFQSVESGLKDLQASQEKFARHFNSHIDEATTEMAQKCIEDCGGRTVGTTREGAKCLLACKRTYQPTGTLLI